MTDRWTIQSAKSRWSERVAGVARGLRRAVSRDNLIADLKTLVTVAPLTVLVWIYAEQQQLVTDKDTVVVAVQSDDPVHRMVTLLNPSDGTIQLTLQGSQVGIDRIKALMRQTITSRPLDLKVVGGLAPGRQQLVTLDTVENNAVFTAQGVTVTACTPETMLVRVDELVERAATVEAPDDVPGLLKAVFDPPTVKIRGPASLLDDLERNGALRAVADLTSEPAVKVPGEHDKLTVGFVPQPNITFIPDTVSADLRIGEANESIQVSPVPVKVEASKWLMDNYKFAYKEWLTDPVTLVGPRQQVTLINPANARVTAVVNLDNTDADFHGLKPITFQDNGLPEGVTVKPDASPRQIQIGVDAR
jgi:hypothetical protein